MYYHTIYDETTKTWSGLKTLPTYNPNVSAAQVILNTLKMNSNKIGQINDNNGIQMKNGEIRRKTIRAAQHLLEMGYKKNDVIGIVAKNHHNLAPIVFAAFAIGAPVNPIDPNFVADEIVQMMQKTRPKLIFCDADNFTAVQEASMQLEISVPIFTFDGVIEGARPVDELFVDTGTNINHFVPTDIGDGTQHPLVIICSSGSSGLAKGICLSHAVMLEHATNIYDTTGADVALCFSSIYWLSGFLTLAITTICGTTRINTTEPFQPELMLHLIEKYKVTVTMTPPHQLALLLQSKALPTANLSSLNKYFCAGSLVPQEMISRMNKFLPDSIFVTYGMSEVAGVLTINISTSQPGSVGQLRNGYTVKIIDDDGNHCGIGQNGEICIAMQYPNMGYYNDAENSAVAFDSEGWFHTGDVGHFDDDGYLFLVDRVRDIIKFTYYMISPSEVEEVIMKHPGVVAVCVVGIPDMLWTELPAAVVMKNDDYDVTESEIADAVKNTMPNYKQLRGGVYFVKSLPLTSTGKVIRRGVKEIAIKMYNQRPKA